MCIGAGIEAIIGFYTLAVNFSEVDVRLCIGDVTNVTWYKTGS